MNKRGREKECLRVEESISPPTGTLSPNFVDDHDAEDPFVADY